MTEAVNRYLTRLIAQCQPHVDPGEQVWLALPGQRGLGSNKLVMATVFTQPLLLFQTFRVVALTNHYAYVFKAGWFRRTTPKRLIVRLPKTNCVRVPTPGGRRYFVGDEKLDVPNRSLAPALLHAARWAGTY